MCWKKSPSGSSNYAVHDLFHHFLLCHHLILKNSLIYSRCWNYLQKQYYNGRNYYFHFIAMKIHSRQISLTVKGQEFNTNSYRLDKGSSQLNFVYTFFYAFCLCSYAFSLESKCRISWKTQLKFHVNLESTNYTYNVPSAKLMLNKWSWKKKINEWISKLILLRHSFFMSDKYSTWLVYMDKACIVFMSWCIWK